MAAWVTRQRSPVLVEDSGESWAIYLAGSSRTHLVGKVAGEVLCFLEETPRSEESIRDLISRLLEDDTITLERVREDWLLPLEATGLVEEVV